ncbi:hypothetical protein ACJJTC_010109 [Scirpophaga incertulas]
MEKIREGRKRRGKNFEETFDKSTVRVSGSRIQSLGTRCVAAPHRKDFTVSAGTRAVRRRSVVMTQPRSSSVGQSVRLTKWIVKDVFCWPYYYATAEIKTTERCRSDVAAHSPLPALSWWLQVRCGAGATSCDMPQIFLCKTTQRHRSDAEPPPQRIVCPRSQAESSCLHSNYQGSKDSCDLFGI